MKLDQFHRCQFAHLPTPIEHLPRLTEYLGGPQLFVKRDDQTGLAFGGNKARKLEYLVCQAINQGCDTLVTTGGPQSNHARQTAAAAAKFGLGCELVLPKVVPIHTAEYESSGNVLLDRLLGANVVMPSSDQFSQGLIDARLGQIRAAGKKPYYIPIGGSTPLGSLGYVRAAHEFLQQAGEKGIAIDAIVVPTGSAGTHAGLLAGLMLPGSRVVLRGIAVSGTAEDKSRLVGSLTEQTLDLLGESRDGVADRVYVTGDFVGPGYGLPTEAMIEAVDLVARLEGLLLDPVYTGKAMAGLIHAVRGGEFSRAHSVLFWHTGGTAALFAYHDVFDAFVQCAKNHPRSP